MVYISECSEQPQTPFSGVLDRDAKRFNGAGDREDGDLAVFILIPKGVFAAQSFMVGRFGMSGLMVGLG